MREMDGRVWWGLYSIGPLACGLLGDFIFSSWTPRLDQPIGGDQLGPAGGRDILQWGRWAAADKTVPSSRAVTYATIARQPGGDSQNQNAEHGICSRLSEKIHSTVHTTLVARRMMPIYASIFDTVVEQNL
jgi:hypothetical protein